MRWLDVAGLDVPVHHDAGPTVLAAGRVSGFARTDLGAAFAAVHLLVRTFPFAGSAVFGPTIATQVVGRDAPALARLTEQAYEPAAKAAGVKDGGPIRSEGGVVAGYRLDPTTDDSTRTVRILIHRGGEPDSTGFTEYRVQLTWQTGDWRLIAPAWGDWRNAARPMSSADPAGYRSYYETGLT